MALWWVDGNLLQEGLCHTQVCCTQSPDPCSRPLLTQTSTGDTQTLKCSSGSVSVECPGAHKVLLEPFRRLCWVWGLILNTISPFLPSCWGFSFALGCGVSPQSHSTTTQPSTYCLAGASLPLDVGYLLTAAPVPCSHCFLTPVKFSFPPEKSHPWLPAAFTYLSKN